MMLSSHMHFDEIATAESTNGVIGESATSTCKKIGAAVCYKRRIAGQEQLVARNDELCKKKRKDTDKGTTKKLPAKCSTMTREFTQVSKYMCLMFIFGIMSCDICYSYH